MSTGRQLLSLWQADAPQVVVPPFASSLTAPTYDEAGYLWVGGADAGDEDHIYVLDPRASAEAATPVAVKAPWLKDRRVVSLAVAGDGVRLLVITTNRQGTDAQLGVSGIQRLPNGRPTGLAAPLRQAQPLLVLTDVVWLDTTRSTYAVLGQVSEADPSATLGGHDRTRAWKASAATVDPRRSRAAPRRCRAPSPSPRSAGLAASSSRRPTAGPGPGPAPRGGRSCKATDVLVPAR